MRPFILHALFALVLGTSACTLDAGSDEDALTTTTPIFAKPADDAATSVSVKNGMTFTLHASLAWKTEQSLELILNGSTSQDIVSVQGFIPDDAFGTATQTSKRAFKLVFDSASDIDTVIS